MYVYFIRCLETEFVKIGKANNVEKRLNDMQTGCPYELAIMFKIKCDSEQLAYDIEKKLHRTFQENRYRAEWFKIRGSHFKKLISEFDDLSVHVGEFQKKFITPRAEKRRKKRKKQNYV